MADNRYVVTAPYVTLRVKDANGAWVLRGFYKDAQVLEADVDADSLLHHVDSGLVEPVEQPKAEAKAEPKPAPAKPSAKNS